MSTSLAQIQFAAEFVTFLVAAAGLALVAINPETATDRWWTRLALAAGFTAMGVAAFGRGSLLVKPESLTQVDRLRVVGTRRWRAGSRTRRAALDGIAGRHRAVPSLTIGPSRRTLGEWPLIVRVWGRVSPHSRPI